MSRFSTLDQIALERRLSQIGDEIDVASDVLVKLDLIQERISLRALLGSLQPRGVLSLV